MVNINDQEFLGIWEWEGSLWTLPESNYPEFEATGKDRYDEVSDQEYKEVRFIL